jgi:hypothetical protein
VRQIGVLMETKLGPAHHTTHQFNRREQILITMWIMKPALHCLFYFLVESVLLRLIEQSNLGRSIRNLFSHCPRWDITSAKIAESHSLLIIASNLVQTVLLIFCESCTAQATVLHTKWVFGIWGTSSATQNSNSCLGISGRITKTELV